MDEPTVVVGVVTKVHGLRGEVAVELRSDNPERFAAGSELFTADGRRLTVLRAHPHGDRLLVSFEGIDDRDGAETLRGTSLQVPQSWLPDLPEGEYWPFQLEGCAVRTESGRSLGTLIDVIPYPANDLWVTRDGAGEEILVPAIRDVIVEVDIKEQRIVVRDVPGLTT